MPSCYAVGAKKALIYRAYRTQNRGSKEKIPYPSKSAFYCATNLKQRSDETTLFLGGKEKTTLKEMSEILGKETIDSFNTSETRGRELSHGLNYQKLGKQLMSEDEIAVMDGGKCILQLRGVRPFFSEKYDITKHPKYKYLSDFDKKNAFDMEKHLRRRPAIVKPDEVFDYYEVDEADLQEDTENE